MFEALRNLFGRKRAVEPTVEDWAGTELGFALNLEIAKTMLMEQARETARINRRLVQMEAARKALTRAILDHAAMTTNHKIGWQSPGSSPRELLDTRFHRLDIETGPRPDVVPLPVPPNPFDFASDVLSKTGFERMPTIPANLIAAFQKLADDAGREGSR